MPPYKLPFGESAVVFLSSAIVLIFVLEEGFKKSWKFSSTFLEFGGGAFTLDQKTSVFWKIAEFATNSTTPTFLAKWCAVWSWVPSWIIGDGIKSYRSSIFSLVPFQDARVGVGRAPCSPYSLKIVMNLLCVQCWGARRQVDISCMYMQLLMIIACILSLPSSICRSFALDLQISSCST